MYSSSSINTYLVVVCGQQAADKSSRLLQSTARIHIYLVRNSTATATATATTAVAVVVFVVVVVVSSLSS